MGSNGSRRPLIGLTTYLEPATCLVWETEFALLHRIGRQIQSPVGST